MILLINQQCHLKYFSKYHVFNLSISFLDMNLRKNHLAFALFFILFLCQILFVNGQQINSQTKPIKTKIEFGPEFIWPSSPYSPIYTTSVNGFFWTRYFKKAELNINLGITTTFAWGSSVDEYKSTRTKLVYAKTKAFGIGPVLHFNQSIFEMKRFSISATAVAGAMPVGASVE